MSAWGTQKDGTHYKTMKIQPMKYSMDNELNSLQHTIVKYVSRYKDKNGVKDLEKARHCVDMLIEYELATQEDVATEIVKQTLMDAIPNTMHDPIYPEGSAESTVFK